MLFQPGTRGLKYHLPCILCSAKNKQCSSILMNFMPKIYTCNNHFNVFLFSSCMFLSLCHYLFWRLKIFKYK